METKTLYTWDSKSILRMLDAASVRLAVLSAAGVDVPLFEVNHARELLLNVLIRDVAAEVLPKAEAVAAVEMSEAA